MIHRVFLAAVVLATAVLPAVVSAQEIYLDLMEPGPKSGAVATNCSSWHELWPAYCALHHQDDFLDNGDGIISACDQIKLDGQWFHIEWAGPTYFLSCATSQTVFEPTDPGTGGDPTCEIWTEVHPNNGQQAHVDGWQDNGDGVLSVCDYILIAGQTCHVDRIGLNIRIRPTTVPVEIGTWGRIKGFFGNIF
jgi:hypothetical protein